MTIVYGAFIWTSSHDQRLRSLSSALLRSWLRSPVGPEPPSTWSARSEVRTNDLDGHLSVELLGDPSRSLSVAEGRVPAARGAADMIGESSSGGASSGATEQALCGTLGAMGARDREAWLTMRTRRFSLAIGTLRRSAVEASPEAGDRTDASLASAPTRHRGGHRSRPSHSTGTHPPQRGAGTLGAAALAVTGPPLSRGTQPGACRFALYWLRAATRARPAASTTSVDDARTATLRPGSSTSSSTSPTASLPGPTE